AGGHDTRGSDLHAVGAQTSGFPSEVVVVAKVVLAVTPGIVGVGRLAGAECSIGADAPFDARDHVHVEVAAPQGIFPGDIDTSAIGVLFFDVDVQKAAVGP